MGRRDGERGNLKQQQQLEERGQVGMKRSKKKLSERQKKMRVRKKEVHQQENSEALDVGRDIFHIPSVVQGCQGLLPLFPANRSSPASGKDKAGWGAWEQGSDLYKYLL